MQCNGTIRDIYMHCVYLIISVKLTEELQLCHRNLPKFFLIYCKLNLDSCIPNSMLYLSPKL